MVYVCTMTIHQATQQLTFQLLHIYEEREARNIAGLVMEKITEWKRIDRVVNKHVPLSPDKQQLLGWYTEELLSHKPVQYVLNEAWFCGLKLYVDEYVLIPRPETEELVEWVVQEVRGMVGENTNHVEKLKILDIGTGSGCIAIALKKKYPGAVVYACDVSEKALIVAARNATKHNTEISFILCDFLTDSERKELPAIDMLVSNPPYIPQNDKRKMHSNVVEFEPKLALFVPDEAPLVFYDALADFAKTHLSKTGGVYVEINEESGREVAAVFTKKDFRNTVLKKDLQGKDRMIKATLQRSI